MANSEDIEVNDEDIELDDSINSLDQENNNDDEIVPVSNNNGKPIDRTSEEYLNKKKHFNEEMLKLFKKKTMEDIPIALKRGISRKQIQEIIF